MVVVVVVVDVVVVVVVVVVDDVVVDTIPHLSITCDFFVPAVYFCWLKPGSKR